MELYINIRFQTCGYIFIACMAGAKNCIKRWYEKGSMKSHRHYVKRSSRKSGVFCRCSLAMTLNLVSFRAHRSLNRAHIDTIVCCTLQPHTYTFTHVSQFSSTMKIPNLIIRNTAISKFAAFQLMH